MDRYDPQAIEAKWQAEWEREGAFVVPNPSPDDAPREHTYVLEMLPYPSGELHMGHVLNYTLGDVVAHIRRRRGFTVLRPIGYDAFGLPAENAAIREGKHPRDVTNRNIAAIREQMKRLGWSIDWSRELSTAEPDYYHWTQWLFLKFFEAGLAYRKGAIVNWCPNDQTVLANEQVIDGHCERCGWEVEARTLEQWFFRITAYADRLLDDMAMLESWPERVLTMQRNWIGRSEGAEVVFRIEELDIDIPVFTTRPDTLFGATFFVLAPEHALVERLVKGTPHEQEVMDYVRHAAGRPVAERADPEKEKTGVSTGRFVTNPVNDNRLPIWVSDYVLMEYGTGAIMAVPAHDERDYAFAKRFELPIKTVIAPADGEVPEDEAFVPHSDDEVLVDSAQFSAMTSPEAKKAIVTWLESRERGRPAVSFRLRDWLLSRQRYWGCPIPILYCDECGLVPVPEDDLPVLLPEVEEYVPKGRSPLAAAEDWVATTCPKCGGPARRETDTMDTFVDSSWYFLRYCDPKTTGRRSTAAWSTTGCPSTSTSAGSSTRSCTSSTRASSRRSCTTSASSASRSRSRGSSTRGCSITAARRCPSRRGTSSPPTRWSSATGPRPSASTSSTWARPRTTRSGRTRASRGCSASSAASGGSGSRSLESGQADGEPEGPLVRKAHETIAKVSDDIERRFQFNTPIAAVIELVNDTYVAKDDPEQAAAVRFATETAVSLIQPYVPHIAEELWQRLGHERLWRPVARGRPRSPRARDLRARRPGERPSARPGRGACRACGRRARRARQGAPAGRRPPRRQRGEERHRRARPARKPGRLAPRLW